MVVIRDAVRFGCAVVVCGSALLGCTSGGDGEPSEPRAAKKAGATRSTGPSATAVVDVDPAALPTTKAQAAALIRDVIAAPSDFGPGAVPRTPYESDPRRWPVLGDDCVWHQRALPKDVLATSTRSYEIPASGAKGPLRLSAVVTVHHDAEQADWENAEVLEEMMRCPGQRLRSDEMITSLNDVPNSWGDSGNAYADDVLTELGSYTSAEVGGPHEYLWGQTRIGQFTLAVSAKGSKGWSRADLFERLRDPHAGMRARLRAAIERDTPKPGGSTKGDRR
ncbi:hypothetical protein GCM10009680_40160 [Streptomyces yatensis]|uniref:PknH-like extracellular domain-containing protein n=1 Tax=Streptomyces yatensis TaxID=155177 RepID=A0ABN2HZG0_9ACTN